MIAAIKYSTKNIIFVFVIMFLSFDSAAQTLLAQGPMGAAVVYDRSSKFDHSFNQAVFENGVVKLRELGYKIKEVEPANNVQTQLGVMKLARRGYNPVIGIGYAVSPAIERAAKAYPNISFVIVDNVINLPNVQSITFKEEQGAYLAGVLAALKTENQHLGFIGGMDIPLITKFSCGYTLGAQSVNPDIKITRHYIGSTANAWSDPSKGIEVARHQFEQGADVIFAAAGGSGLGVYQAASDHGFFAIAVDSNQNNLYPGAVLSSMVKLVGRAVLETVINFNKGTWLKGHFAYGLTDNWVGLIRDDYNQFSYERKLYDTVEQSRLTLLADINMHKSVLSTCDVGAH